MKLTTTRFLLVISTLFLFSFSLYGQRFDRSAVIPVEPDDIGGIGNIVAGVDFDGDGKKEIYTVNNDWHDQAGLDWTPRIYKYEKNNGRWEIVWWTALDISRQNTWPALAAADLDNDGKWEIVFGPVNNFSAENLNPARIVVFESAGDGSDVMGVADGDVAFRPNAQWTITEDNGVNIRPFRWEIHDIDDDGTDEIITAKREGAEGAQIYSVDDVPDTGDSSETWTMEFSGVPGTHWDMFVMDSTAWFIRDNGEVTPVTWSAAGDSFRVGDVQVGAVPGGSWKSATVVDLNNDGIQEVLVASWSSGSRNVYLLQHGSEPLTTTLVKEVPAESNRLYGGAAGDIDNDGNVDFVFGTRQATPNGIIHRLEYVGGDAGDLTDPNNYELSILDHGISPTATQYDIVSVANMDNDPEDEVLYTGTPRGNSRADVLAGTQRPQPLVILDRIPGNQPVIQNVADVPHDNGRQTWVSWWGAADDVGGMRFDADLSGDGVSHGRGTFTLDRENHTLWYMLEVYNIDSVAQAHIHQGGPDDSGPVVAFLFGPVEPNGPMNGVIARGRITADDLLGPLAGDWEGFVNDLLVGNTYVNVHTATNPGGEIRGQILTRPLEDDSNLSKTSGYTITHYVVWRIDGLGPDRPGPVPVQVARVDAIQSHRYAAVVPTLWDSSRTTYVVSAHTENVLTLWKSFPKSGFSVDNLAPSAPTNVLAKEVEGNSSFVELTWDESPAEDFNYFIVVKGTEAGFDPGTAENIGNTTETTLTDEAVSTGQTFYYRVAAVDFNGNQSEYSEEVSLLITSVNEDSFIPTEYALEQNYPNPFNPTTTIDFSIKDKGHVLLKVYSMLGREVATLADKEYEAGRYSVVLDASQMASGVYFYILKVNGRIFKNKMSLLK